jgi:uncharacterized protein YecE (DUF72 family)
LERTADWGYVRFHEGRARPHPCYGEQALATWVDHLAGLWPAGEEVYAFFNNDPKGCAVRDAVSLGRRARVAGWETTRVPEAGEVAVG